MIIFEDMLKDRPYLVFKKLYDRAINNNQTNIEAVSVSSFNTKLYEVNSRFVNLKYIKKDKWIFYTNYRSPKSFDFRSHPQISAIFYWSYINVQIRIRAKITKESNLNSDKHYVKRSIEKNALAWSSDQSTKISSYDEVKEKYFAQLNSDISKRPPYWGGYHFIPYYFEFWEGHESRLNKREVFNKIDGLWKQSYLQP